MGEHEHGVTLINRLRPAPLESLGSLLERLRVANHYHERGWLGGVLGRHPARPEVLRRVADVQTLGALTGLDRATLIGLTLHRFAPWYGVDRRLGRPLPAGVAYLPVPLWPDIGSQGHTREAAAVCPACWEERAVSLLPWWLHHLTACPRHLMLLRQRCARCDAPLRLAAGQMGCGQCGAAIAAMPTYTIAGDAAGVEVSALLWRATGCVEGASPAEGLTLGVGHPLRGRGTPALLRGLWGYAQALVAGDGGPRLQGREIGEVHGALVAAWRGLRARPEQGAAFPIAGDGRGGERTGRNCGVSGRQARWAGHVRGGGRDTSGAVGGTRQGRWAGHVRGGAPSVRRPHSVAYRLSHGAWPRSRPSAPWFAPPLPVTAHR